MNTLNLVDRYLCDEREQSDKDRILNAREGYFWPSECNVLLPIAPGLSREIGGCRRRTYWRWKKVPKTNPTTAQSLRRFSHGDSMEIEELSRMKRFGLLMSDITKQAAGQDPVKKISWKLDGIMYDPDYGIGGVEVKSFYGYAAKKEIFGGNTGRGKAKVTIQGSPRLDNLIQVMVYLDCTKLAYFKIIYAARDDVKHREFVIKLDPAGKARIMDPEVGMDEIFAGFSIHDIYDRNKDLLVNYIEKGVLPPMSYIKTYSEEEVNKRASLGLIPETRLKDWTTNPEKNPIGDWQCNPLYCSHHDLCQEQGA